MNKLNKLFKVDVLTGDQFASIEEHAEVKSCEDCGNSGRVYGATVYNVILQNGDEHEVLVKH